MADPVGAIFIALGLDSARFQAGLKSASGSMSSFAANASKYGAAAGVAFAGMATAVSAAIKGAFDQADDMGKTAQKIGLPVEELSKLAYAAKLADVDVASLSTAMVRLSKNMVEAAAGGTGPAAQAFNTLGIAVKNADGSMKTTAQITSEIAEKFAGFADGANKTALAVALFGKSGADLIPMLNAGATGLASAAAEAERFGIVISGSTSIAAEGFNDNMTRLGAIMNGVVLNVMAQLAPEFERLSNGMVGAAGSAGLFEAAAEGVAIVIRGLVNIAVHATRTIQELAAAFRAIGNAGSAIMNLDGAALAKAGSGFMAEYDRIKKAHLETVRVMNTPASPFGGLQGAKKALEKPKPDAPGMVEKGSGKAAKQEADETIGALDAIERAGKRVWENTRTPAEKLTNELGRLQDMLAVGAISWDTHARAVQQAMEKYDKAIVSSKDVSSNLGNSLGGMWDDFIDGTLNAAESIKKLGQSMLKMLGNKLIGSLMDSLFKPAGAAGGAGGGIMGSLLSAFGIKGFASGGDFIGGRAIMVGERGPELIHPRRSGTVVPNHELGGPVSASMSVVVENHGADVQTRQETGPNGMPQLKVIVRQVMMDDVAKNGPFAQMIQNTYGQSRSAGRR